MNINQSSQEAWDISTISLSYRKMDKERTQWFGEGHRPWPVLVPGQGLKLCLLCPFQCSDQAPIPESNCLLYRLSSLAACPWLTNINRSKPHVVSKK